MGGAKERDTEREEKRGRKRRADAKEADAGHVVWGTSN